jgi:hypothetical protein
MPYFRRTEHAALLMVATLVTYGIGGLVYWLLRREGWVCPGCGVSWSRPFVTHGPVPAHVRDGLAAATRPSLPAGGFLRRVLGVLLAVAAVSVLILAISEASGVAFAIAAGLGLSGILLFRWGREALERRREGVLVALQNQTLHLARARSGRLTATEAAAELRLTLPAAENVLFSMDDGFRVRSEITREGLLVFDFPELRFALLEDGTRGLGRSRDLA